MNAPFEDIEGNPRNMSPNDQFILLSQTEANEDPDEAIVEQPTKAARKPRTQTPAVKKVKKSVKARASPPEMDVIHRKPRRGVPLPLDPRLSDHYATMAQSAVGGWIEESDSEDNSDVFEEVRRLRMDPTFQVYLIIGLIVVVLAVVGSVRLHEFLYGKPDIPENSFDFLRNFTEDEL